MSRAPSRISRSISFGSGAGSVGSSVAVGLSRSRKMDGNLVVVSVFVSRSVVVCTTVLVSVTGGLFASAAAPRHSTASTTAAMKLSAANTPSAIAPADVPFSGSGS